VNDREPAGVVERHTTKAVKKRREAEMNHSFYSADKATHLKIIVLSAAAAVMLTVGATALRISGNDLQTAGAVAPVVKAGGPTVWTSNTSSFLR
jgi:hypothetical protein